MLAFREITKVSALRELFIPSRTVFISTGRTQRKSTSAEAAASLFERQITALPSNGESFSVGVANPDETDKTLITLKCKDGVIVSTSGGYERFYEVNGKKYSHIISPKTLFPAENNKSVTVICKSGYLADTLSTALYILDYKSGLNLINKTKNCEACIIDNSSNIHYSNGFNKYK